MNEVEILDEIKKIKEIMNGLDNIQNMMREICHPFGVYVETSINPFHELHEKLNSNLNILRLKLARSRGE